jgi:ribonuclease-3
MTIIENPKSKIQNPKSPVPSLNKLIARLGFVFADLHLLESALTHRSFVHEHPELAYRLVDNERLEFLGDSVINYIAADMLYQRFPNHSEGELTVARSALIKTSTLAQFAREYDLGTYIRMNKGEESSGARERDAMLADTFEALLAAICLDRGMDGAREFVTPLFERVIEQNGAQSLSMDYKSRLQRRFQSERGITPLYRVIAESGPEHRREYTVEVLGGAELLGIGNGVGKQAASQEAARVALEKLDQSAE